MANLTMKVLQEQINELRNKVAILEATNKVRKIPVGLGVGDTFEISGINWKILDITEKGYMCLADKLEDSMEFDERSSDWEGSQLREYLNTEFFEKISDEIGEENIITFNRDLTSLDGQTEYGKCEDMLSLLTIDEYRKYRKLINNTNFYWWLISPWSTPCNDWNRSVTVVAPAGCINRNSCDDCHGGVRPVCIFSSLIFESEE